MVEIRYIFLSCACNCHRLAQYVVACLEARLDEALYLSWRTEDEVGVARFTRSHSKIVSTSEYAKTWLPALAQRPYDHEYASRQTFLHMVAQTH